MLTHEERLFLNMAESSRLLDPTQASQAMKALRSAREQGNPIAIWDLLVHWGYLSPQQAQQLLEVSHQAMSRIRSHEMTTSSPSVTPPTGFPAAAPGAAPAIPPGPVAQDFGQIPLAGQPVVPVLVPVGVQIPDQQWAYPEVPALILDPSPAAPTGYEQPVQASQTPPFAGIPAGPAASPELPLGKPRRPGTSAVLKVKLKKRAAHGARMKALIIGATAALLLLVVGAITWFALSGGGEGPTEQPDRLAEAAKKGPKSPKSRTTRTTVPAAPVPKQKPGPEQPPDLPPPPDRPPGAPPSDSSEGEETPSGEAPTGQAAPVRAPLGDSTDSDRSGEGGGDGSQEGEVEEKSGRSFMPVRTAGGGRPAATPAGQDASKGSEQEKSANAAPVGAATDSGGTGAGTGAQDGTAGKSGAPQPAATLFAPKAGIIRKAGESFLPVRAWKAIGPFGHPDMKNRPDATELASPAHDFVSRIYTEATYPPDGCVDIGAIFKGGLTRNADGQEEEVSWQDVRVHAEEHDLRVENSVVQFPNKEELAKGVGLSYFSTWVHVPRQTALKAVFPAYGEGEPATEKFGASVKVWLNGKPLEHHKVQPDNPYLYHPADGQALSLLAGWNHVYAKVWSTWAGTKMALVLKGEEREIELVSISSSPPRTVGRTFSIDGKRKSRSQAPRPDGLIGWATSDTEIPQGPPADASGYGGHHYKVFVKKAMWTAAWKECEDMGGTLACIGSKEENEFVARLLGGRKAWVGGTDDEVEGTWKWVNGEECAYTNWAAGSPRNVSGNEDYLYLAEDGKWLNSSKTMLSDLERYVCEWEK